jgi:hypothetical protein
MITREEYLKALDTVEAYHKQINLKTPVSKSFDTDISKLEIGGFVQCSKKPTRSKNFTHGNMYEILCKKPERPSSYGYMCAARLQIRHDNGGLYWVSCRNHYKTWRCG